MIADDVDRATAAARAQLAAEKVEHKQWWDGQQDRLEKRRQVK